MPLRDDVRRFLFALGALIAALAINNVARAEVTVTEVDKKLRVEIDGQLFTEYVYQEWPRPYLYPVLGPHQAPMTRSWPIKEGVPGEQKDHPHHRSIWHGHQGVNGFDLWTEGKGRGTIAHVELVEAAGGEVGTIVARNHWLGPDEQVLCSDETTLRFGADDAGARWIDYEVLVKASHGELVLGDEKDAFVAMRVNPALRITNWRRERGTGFALNSAGERDAALWGQAAKWVDYWGPIDGHTVGIAIFDHPDNLRHPTTWHARDYGLVTANPFGLHFFSEGKLDRQAGRVVIEENETMHFRYRFYLHEGDAESAKIADRYREYATAGDE